MPDPRSKETNVPKDSGEQGGSSAPARSAGKLQVFVLSVIKFVLGLSLLPFCIGGTVAFYKNFSSVGYEAQVYFLSGIIAFLLLFFLVWEPMMLYSRGQKIVESVFQFFAPLVKVASYVIPAYLIVLFVAYAACFIFKTEVQALKYIMFLIGFTQTLHLVFTARSLRKKNDFLKANYIFGFSLIYMLNLLILAAGFHFMFSEFSFLRFFSSSVTGGVLIYQPLVRQLFAV